MSDESLMGHEVFRQQMAAECDPQHDLHCPTAVPPVLLFGPDSPSRPDEVIVDGGYPTAIPNVPWPDQMPARKTPAELEAELHAAIFQNEALI